MARVLTHSKQLHFGNPSDAWTPSTSGDPTHGKIEAPSQVSDIKLRTLATMWPNFSWIRSPTSALIRSAPAPELDSDFEVSNASVVPDLSKQNPEEFRPLYGLRTKDISEANSFLDIPCLVGIAGLQQVIKTKVNILGRTLTVITLSGSSEKLADDTPRAADAKSKSSWKFPRKLSKIQNAISEYR
ncbi:hypothetical protein C8R45DRAFT_937257 [Mycena sanguinolenta]|nr:hypothetical protein C8R45DRAFT_937257 [Mycena sanguinolenta]